MPRVSILAGHRESMLVMTHVDVRSPVQYAKLPAGGSDIAAWSLREVSPPGRVCCVMRTRLSCSRILVMRMNILSRMRDHDRRVGLQIYKHLRLGLAVASPLFVVAGVLGLLGFGDTKVNRQTVQGLSRVIADLALIALGVLIGIVRLTVFRVQRPVE